MNSPTISCNGVSVPIAIDGYARIKNSLGCHLFAEENDTYSLVISNGWVNHGESLGGVFFDAIRLNMPFGVIGVPWAAHATGSDGRVVIGSENGIPHNYLAPRGVHVYRFARIVTGKPDEWWRVFERGLRRGNSPHVAAPESLAYLKAEYDAKGEANLTRMATATGFGPFVPEGGERGDDPGGTDIDGTPGWDRSFLYRATRHMLRMNRTPVALIDAATGKPVLSQRSGYYSTRTWNKSGVLPEFVMARSMSPYDDNRVARDVNTGSCSYRGKFVPEQTANGAYTYPYEADNGEHFCRATAHAKALAYLYRDKAAMLTLQAMAADVWAAWKPVAVKRGEGLDGPLRGVAWTLDALQAAGYEAQAALIARNLAAAQMPCGAWQRVVSANEPMYGHSPSPWRDCGMPPIYDASSSKENAYTALALAAHGEVKSAERCMSSMYLHGDPEIWQACAQSGALMPALENRTVGWREKHQHWGALGVLARINLVWRRQMSLLMPPDGTSPCGADVKGALLRSRYWEGVAAALESLEQP